MNFWGRITEGRLFQSHLWPNQWSHRVPIGTKWKIWIWSFQWLSWFVNYCLSKSSTWLSKCSKPLESGPFLQKRKNLEVLHFVDRWRDFQTANYALPIIRKFSILHMNFSLSACILVLFVAIANGHQGHANCKGKYRNTLDLEQHWRAKKGKEKINILRIRIRKCFDKLTLDGVLFEPIYITIPFIWLDCWLHISTTSLQI